MRHLKHGIVLKTTDALFTLRGASLFELTDARIVMFNFVLRGIHLLRCSQTMVLEYILTDLG